MKALITGLLGLLLVGCANFATNAFRTEQTIANAAHAAYVGYTNALASGVIHPSETLSNDIRTARLKLGASLSTVDGWRVIYETNAAVKPYLQSAITATELDSSNMVWLINYARQ